MKKKIVYCFLWEKFHKTIKYSFISGTQTQQTNNHPGRGRNSVRNYQENWSSLLIPTTQIMIIIGYNENLGGIYLYCICIKSLSQAQNAEIPVKCILGDLRFLKMKNTSTKKNLTCPESLDLPL